MDKSKSKGVYFPGLNALRFFAAGAVILTHLELFKARWQYPNTYGSPAIKYAGGLGVDFFFVLSGFLITYLLFVEKDRFGKISIKNFYFRRIFRIWPLYYFTTILAFFIIPNIQFLEVPTYSATLDDNFTTKLFWYLTIFPNIAKSFFKSIPYASMSWSIGVEEQFYLFWPIIIHKAKRPLIWLIGVFVFFMGLKAGVLLLSKMVSDPASIKGLKNLTAMTRIEVMAIGGIGAWLVYNKKEKILDILYSLPLQLITLLGFIPLAYFFGDTLNDLIHLVFGAIFLIIILNISCNPKSILKLENKYLGFLGRISYGIYMYHMLAIGIVLAILRIWLSDIETGSVVWNTILYLCSFLLTILLATASYYYLEKPFMRLKSKYTSVVSGNEARQ